MSGRPILLVAVVGIALVASANSTEPAAAPSTTSRPAAGGPPSLGPPGIMPGGENGSKASDRLRENTKLIDVLGTFQSAGGDSVSFSRDGGKDSFRVLEN